MTNEDCTSEGGERLPPPTNDPIQPKDLLLKALADPEMLGSVLPIVEQFIGDAVDRRISQMMTAQPNPAEVFSQNEPDVPLGQEKPRYDAPDNHSFSGNGQNPQQIPQNGQSQGQPRSSALEALLPILAQKILAPQDSGVDGLIKQASQLTAIAEMFSAPYNRGVETAFNLMKMGLSGGGDPDRVAEAGLNIARMGANQAPGQNDVPTT